MKRKGSSQSRYKMHSFTINASAFLVDNPSFLGYSQCLPLPFKVHVIAPCGYIKRILHQKVSPFKKLQSSHANLLQMSAVIAFGVDFCGVTAWKHSARHTYIEAACMAFSQVPPWWWECYSSDPKCVSFGSLDDHCASPCDVLDVLHEGKAREFDNCCKTWLM